MIKEPKINAMSSSANPLMILGCLFIVAPFLLGTMPDTMIPNIIDVILFIIGGLFFAMGLVMWVAENF